MIPSDERWRVLDLDFESELEFGLWTFGQLLIRFIHICILIRDCIYGLNTLGFSHSETGGDHSP